MFRAVKYKARVGQTFYKSAVWWIHIWRVSVTDHSVSLHDLLMSGRVSVQDLLFTWRMSIKGLLPTWRVSI